MYLFCILLLLLNSFNLIKGDGLLYRTENLDRAIRTPDSFKIGPDFIEINGYVAEVHEVSTEDGYILQLHRVLIRGAQNESRPVVLVEHGIISSSDTWLLLGQTSFPFILANNGFDVWLGNTRGNRYGLRHHNISITSPKFWDFSVHEEGYFDVAASIDYVLKSTKKSQLFLTGHSRGSTECFILLSTRPEYNAKVKLFNALAPVVYLKHGKSPILQTIFKNSSPKTLKSLANEARLYSSPGINSLNIPLRKVICASSSGIQKYCLNLIFQVSGYHPETLNKTLLPLILTHYPESSSVGEFLHFIQIAQTDEFKRLDYGKKQNFKRYGNLKPPKYNLDQITAPVHLVYGDNDFFTAPKDLERLKRELKSVLKITEVPEVGFNHNDFQWGTTAHMVLYQPLCDFMKSLL